MYNNYDAMENTKNEAKQAERWVVDTRTGLRMTYKEYIEMMQSERN